jgi:uncharacterized membrane protein YkoI
VVGGIAYGAREDGAQGEDVSLEHVPTAAKATVGSEAAGAGVTQIERETKGGRAVYEVRFLVNGDRVEVKVAPDGTPLGW